MDRRKFLGLGLAAIAVVPATLSATDFRKEKPDTWTAHKVDEAIKALYGDVKLEKSEDITIKVPKIASNGGAVPVGVKSDIKAKTVALFQDANPEAAVCVWEVAEGTNVAYGLKIKMKGSGAVTVVVEGTDGKFYTASKSMQVALGGCEG
jgi:sulfur-oxidizing protein SoxY